MSSTALQNPAHNSALLVQNTTSSLSELEIYWKIAEKAHQSGLTKVNSIFDAFFLVGYGQELGISPFSALRTIYVVNGVPTCSGEMMLALIRRSGLLANMEIEELTDSSGTFTGVKCTMTRKDTQETVSISFTLNDARTASLMGKQVWQSYPKNMCRWRAVSNVAKILFGDVIGGLYTFEEIATDNQPIDESGAPIGDIITISKPQQKNNQPPNVTNLQQPAGQDEQQPPEPPLEEDPQPEEPPATTWLEAPNNKQWLMQTLKANSLPGGFFSTIDNTAKGWGDIAKQYKDRTALEKAIFDAMPTTGSNVPDETEALVEEPLATTPHTTDELYPNTFDITAMLDDKWTDSAYSGLCALFNGYFDEDAEDLIQGGLGVENPTQEYSNPIELWNDLIQIAKDTNIQMICSQFIYRSVGKNGRIETSHPILAVSYSRSKFVELIGDKQFTDHFKVTDWSSEEVQTIQPLIISYETKAQNQSGKVYHLITGASVKPLDVPADPSNLDEFFG